jgi:hypothetical protein
MVINLKPNTARDSTYSNCCSELIDYIENDTEIAMPIDKFLNEIE